MQYAERVGALFATADEIALAWRARAELVEMLTVRAAFEWRDDAAFREELAVAVDRCTGSERLPIVLLDEEARTLMANRAFERATGHRREELIGRPAAGLTGGDDAEEDRRQFDDLVEGRTEYVDVVARRVLADGSERVYASHRGAVRAADGTFRCSVGVGRPLHLTDEDRSSFVPPDH